MKFNRVESIAIKIRRTSPTKVLVAGFIFVILVGTIFLNLPIASKSGVSIGLLNALFTATSAVCVTGLVVVNTLEHWTVFGQVIILMLIQIGGVGFMTFIALFFIIIGKKINVRERIVMKAALSQDSLKGIVRLTQSIFALTIAIESLGAILLSIRFIPEYGVVRGIYLSVFHAVSAFCNAGFDLIGEKSLIPYVGDTVVNITIMSLIVFGGLGFIVWMDVIEGIREKIKNKYSLTHMYNKFSVHTKLVLGMTLALILIGFVLFYSYEATNIYTMNNLSEKDKFLASMFQSITSRTAGFNTILLDKMHQASQFVMILLMFIGGSPASTAGGIKTVTFAILLLAVSSEIDGKQDVYAFKRRIPSDLLRKALTVTVISLFVVLGATMILAITEPFPFLALLFESVSAYATVGLTLGLTGSLSFIGKIVIIICMFIGRLGPITIALAMMTKQKENNNIKYPSENVIVG